MPSEVQPGAQKASVSTDGGHGWGEMERVGNTTKKGSKEMKGSGSGGSTREFSGGQSWSTLLKGFGSPEPGPWLHPRDQLHPALEHVLGTSAATSPPPSGKSPQNRHLQSKSQPPSPQIQPHPPSGKTAVSSGSHSRLHLAPSTCQIIQAAPGKSSLWIECPAGQTRICMADPWGCGSRERDEVLLVSPPWGGEASLGCFAFSFPQEMSCSLGKHPQVPGGARGGNAAQTVSWFGPSLRFFGQSIWGQRIEQFVTWEITPLQASSLK